MVKRILLVLFILFCLKVPVSTFNQASYQYMLEKHWIEHIHGSDFFIDWELKGEDWGQQFCNIPASRNHRHFLEPPYSGGAYPSFLDGESIFFIKCVHNRATSYIIVALDWRDAVVVWRQRELGF
jgi:hypothetical protein